LCYLTFNLYWHARFWGVDCYVQHGKVGRPIWSIDRMLNSFWLVIDPLGEYATKFVRHGQCDDRLWLPSQSQSQYRIMLLFDGGTWVWTSCPLPIVVTSQELNLRPLNHKSNTLPTQPPSPPSHTWLILVDVCTVFVYLTYAVFVCGADEISTTGYASDTNDVELDHPQHGLMVTFDLDSTGVVWPLLLVASVCLSDHLVDTVCRLS